MKPIRISISTSFLAATRRGNDSFLCDVSGVGRYRGTLFQQLFHVSAEHRGYVTWPARRTMENQWTDGRQCELAPRRFLDAGAIVTFTWNGGGHFVLKRTWPMCREKLYLTTECRTRNRCFGHVGGSSLPSKMGFFANVYGWTAIVDFKSELILASMFFNDMLPARRLVINSNLVGNIMLSKCQQPI